MASTTPPRHRGPSSDVYNSIAQDLRRTWLLEYMTNARPGDQLELTVKFPGGDDVTQTVTAPGQAPPAPAGPSPVLPDFFYTQRLGPSGARRSRRPPRAPRGRIRARSAEGNVAQGPHPAACPEPQAPGRQARGREPQGGDLHAALQGDRERIRPFPSLEEARSGPPAGRRAAEDRRVRLHHAGCRPRRRASSPRSSSRRSGPSRSPSSEARPFRMSSSCRRPGSA